MTALPLAERELRSSAQRGTTYWTRFGFGLVGATLAALLLYLSPHLGPAPGVLARGWSMLLFLFVLVRSVKLTADSVSRERRQGTLGLLFLTGLKARGIIVAKLIPPLIHCLCVMLAFFPALVISVLLGGIQAGEFARMMMGLVLTTVLGLSIGLTISTFGRERRKSESTAGLVAVGVWFGPGLIDLALQKVAPGLVRNVSVSLFGPGALSAACFGPGFGAGAGRFWMPVLCNLAVIAVLQGVAIWKLSGSWQDGVFGPSRTWRDRWLDKRRQWGVGSSQGRMGIRARLLNINPYCWLAVRERGPALRLWSLLGLCAAATGLGAWLVRDPAGFGLVWLYFTLPVWYLMIRVLVMDEASRTFISQRSSGALEMLLATPLTVRDLVQGQWMGLRRRFSTAATLFLCLTVLALVLNLWLPPPAFFNLQPGQLTAILVAMLFMFAADVVALTWSAMWLSLKCRRQADVAGSTLARIILLPNVVWLFFLIFFSGVGPGVTFAWNLGWWFLFGVAADLFFAIWCRWRLLRNFRYLATLEYLNSGPSGAWGRLLGAFYARCLYRR
jgi:ABC-type Na+ efflux pump permease subunit